MTTAAKAIAGIGGLLATTAVPSTYLAIASSSGNGGEADKVDNRKAGTKWLLDSGYTHNKPTFQSQNSLKHGCSENLFSNNKDESNPKDDTKVYGCAVMGMELGNTGALFSVALGESSRKDIDPKYIKFNSEIAIRKGSEGWIINSRVDNWSSEDATYFEYLLTTYKYDGKQWNQEGDPKLWTDPALMDGSPQSLVVNSGVDTINNQNKTLVIKVPTGIWFSGSDWVSPASTSKAKNKTREKTENWSGVWIDSTDKSEGSWIFQNIELWTMEKKYSQIFCKEETNNACFQKNSAGNNEKTKKPANADEWSTANSGSKKNNEKVADKIPEIAKGIIDKLKDSKGSWAKLEDICEVETEPSEEQRQQLKIYCSKGRASK